MLSFLSLLLIIFIYSESFPTSLSQTIQLSGPTDISSQDVVTVTCATQNDRNCKYATSILVPTTISVISSNAFSNMPNLQKVTLPSTITYIQSYAFSNSPITNINIPSGVVAIDDYAFYQCSQLSSLDLSQCSQLQSIGTQCFLKTGITSISIPASVRTVKDYAFFNAGQLASVVFLPPSDAVPSGNTQIGDQAFTYCNLQTVQFSSAVAFVADYAFYGQSNLVNVICSYPPPRFTYHSFDNTNTLLEGCNSDISYETCCTSFISNTVSPTILPSQLPSSFVPSNALPSLAPSKAKPTVMKRPSVLPTASPTTEAPTLWPTVSPSSEAPTIGPTASPTSEAPSVPPTTLPPTVTMSASPSAKWTASWKPSKAAPTLKPSSEPTAKVPPSFRPTKEPSAAATKKPSGVPSIAPSKTIVPSKTVVPSKGHPSRSPSV